MVFLVTLLIINVLVRVVRAVERWKVKYMKDEIPHASHLHIVEHSLQMNFSLVRDMTLPKLVENSAILFC